MKSAFLTVERRLTGLSMAVACAMLALAASLGMLQILMRFVLEQPAEWSEVLIRFALIWMVFLGIPEAFRQGAMVSIDLMYRLAPEPFRRALHGLISLVTIGLLLVMIWYGWDYAQRGSVQTMAGLESISMFWAYVAIPVGAAFAIVGVIGNFIDPRHLELETAQ
ncbi:MAG TPA: TRAP transporter small permease [Burkholderiaceae bacterium]|nr:TRAP transporter small permease [Burkholderiaceae bacterium]